jgi:hypothetical protein
MRTIIQKALLMLVSISGLVVLECSAQDWIYSTRPGDTLWDLTEKYAKSLGYVEAIRKHNGVEKPTRMKPGTQLRIPVRWLKVQPVSATVAVVAGEAWIIRAGATDKIRLGGSEQLSLGDVIETGADGNVVVEFADESKLVIRGDTRVGMDRLSAYGDTGMVDSGVRLQRGRANIRVTPTKGPGTRFQIRTPAAVSTVRGTRFRVAVEADGSTTRTEVTAGVVDVSADERMRRIPERFGVIASQGESLGRPVKLLPRADVSAIPAVIERVPVKLDWTDIPGAETYRVQVSESSDFEALLVDRTTTTSAVAFDVAVDGEYVLRLRGIDADSLEGLDVDHRFTLNAYPVPPITIKPQLEETVRIAQPEFQWTEPQNVDSYIFQLAGDAGFTDLIVDTETSGTTFTPVALLEEGTYFWHLAVKDKSGETGPFSDVASFTYAKPQPAADMSETPPTVSDNELVLRWSEGLKGSTYHIQVARGKSFDRLIIDEVVSEPSFVVSKPKGGRYSVRIATIELDGFEGAFSDPQTFNIPREGKWWMPLAAFVLAVLLL